MAISLYVSDPIIAPLLSNQFEFEFDSPCSQPPCQLFRGELVSHPIETPLSLSFSHNSKPRPIQTQQSTTTTTTFDQSKRAADHSVVQQISSFPVIPITTREPSLFSGTKKKQALDRSTATQEQEQALDRSTATQEQQVDQSTNRPPLFPLDEL